MQVKVVDGQIVSREEKLDWVDLKGRKLYPSYDNLALTSDAASLHRNPP
jgi:hypothetical protein